MLLFGAIMIIDLRELKRTGKEESDFFWGIQSVSTDTYSPSDDRINILYNDGTIKDISDASDMLNINVLTKKVRKDYFYYTLL